MIDAARLKNRALPDNGVRDLSIDKLARREIAGAGINREIFVVEAERRFRLLGQGKVGLIERTDRSDVFPVIIKDIALERHALLKGFRNHFLAEILVGGVVVEQSEQGLTAEDVNTHRSQIGLFLRRFRREAEAGSIHSHLLQGITLRLLTEFLDGSIRIGAHQTERLGLFGIHRQSCNGEISTRAAMMLDEQAVIHPVELVTRQDQVLIDIPFLEQPLILTNGVSRSLKPGRTFRGLLCSENLNEALAEPCTQVIGLGEMAIE